MLYDINHIVIDVYLVICQYKTMEATFRKNFAKATIRQARPGDLPAIVAAENKSYLPDEAWPEESLADWIPTEGEIPPHYTMLVAVPDGEKEAVGYVIAKVREDAATVQINCLTVEPSHRRQGLGKALLETSCDILCGNYDIKKINLQVRAENLDAIHLYESAGFTKTADLPHYYKGMGGDDGVEMTKYPKKRTPASIGPNA